MNRLHRWYCHSDVWAATVRDQLPWVLRGVELGDDVLEVGPGPGLTTDLLRQRVPHVTAIEIDPRLAEALRQRTLGQGIKVVTGDATAMPFQAARFSAVVSFTMLHHLPSPQLQDRLLAEVCRVLRPGGVFAGSDSTASLLLRLAHLGDTMVLVNPDRFASRLQAAGFTHARVQHGNGWICAHSARSSARHRRSRSRPAAPASRDLPRSQGAVLHQAPVQPDVGQLQQRRSLSQGRPGWSGQRRVEADVEDPPAGAVRQPTGGRPPAELLRQRRAES
ncbi:MAG: class I SAM-dependent methyltransferase, partial [Pseudonocardiales bacterium]|nr:class I SAM-dependent methyltransferase [Pseudonocardiales bacterium]